MRSRKLFRSQENLDTSWVVDVEADGQIDAGQHPANELVEQRAHVVTPRKRSYFVGSYGLRLPTALFNGQNRRRRAAVMVLCVLSVGCARAGFELVDRELDPCWPNCAPTTWGDFAATLDIPDCPSSNPVLAVNTTADELDGGQSITDPSQAGDYLSFAEAIWIAANRGTPHNIFFDAATFPAEAPGVIHIRDYYEMPTAGSGLCIDGRRRGVVVEYDSALVEPCTGAGADICFPPLQDGALLVSLVFANVPWELTPHTSQIAGCRWESAVLLSPRRDIYFGPGNVPTSGGLLLLWSTATGVTVAGNYFGYDPLSRAQLHDQIAITTFSGVMLDSNIVGAELPMTINVGLSTPTPILLTGNRFGVGASGETLPGVVPGLAVVYASGNAGTLRIGPNNVMRGLAGAALEIHLGTAGHAPTITRNVITANGAGIEYDVTDTARLPSPPTITTGTAATVSGTCGAAGTVEVFSDPGAQGEDFLGDTICSGGTWTLSASIPHGRNVTATLTDAEGRTSAFSMPFAIP